MKLTCDFYALEEKYYAEGKTFNELISNFLKNEGLEDANLYLYEAILDLCGDFNENSDELCVNYICDGDDSFTLEIER